MNKLIILGIAATLGAARLTFFQGSSPVQLQTATPGTPQSGHLNISGTATVGVLRSNNTVFGQATAPTGVSYGGFFTAASNQARGFYGYASSPTGLTYGGFFQNASESGRAVFGLATSTTGFNYGGYFQSASADGRAERLRRVQQRESTLDRSYLGQRERVDEPQRECDFKWDPQRGTASCASHPRWRHPHSHSSGRK